KFDQSLGGIGASGRFAGRSGTGFRATVAQLDLWSWVNDLVPKESSMGLFSRLIFFNVPSTSAPGSICISAEVMAPRTLPEDPILANPKTCRSPLTSPII